MGKTNLGTLALIDAFRAEVAETPSEYPVIGSRVGVRLSPEQVAAFAARIDALAHELKDADDPAGEPYGFFVGLHRRAE
jgi:hypothetical protein